MRRVRWLMIVLLAAGAVGLGYKLRADWRSYSARNNPQSLKPRPAAALVVPLAAPARDYTVVSQQNPFHPERNDAVPQEAKASGPPPLVYGSMILGKEKFALLGTESDPKPRKVVEGEMFNGYRLAEVLPQSVVLEADGARNEVMLYNAAARLRREQVRTQSSSAPPPPVQTVGAQSAATTTVESPAAAAQNPYPKDRITAATPAPPGKKWVETPFGPMLVDAK